MRSRVARALIALCAVASVAAIFAVPVGAADRDDGATGRYIVLLEDSVDRPGSVARAQVEQRSGRLGFVYRHAVTGYSAVLPKGAVEGLRADPRVAVVEPDVRGGAAAQTTPTGIKRIFAATNEAIDIDATDDLRVDVDVAVLDSGIDAEHPDLDVVSQVNCNGTETCVAGGGDGLGHGTHVAGTIAAIDNGEGVVGVAPGARLWSVRVLDNGGFGSLSEFIAGVDWVTATREDENPENDIDVANASLRYFTTSSATMTAALKAAVEAGIVPVVAAGNESEPVKYVPGNDPYVITVSAIADYNGLSGAGASPTCQNYGSDDNLASFSNYGSLVEVTAPGVCINSTLPGNKYGFNSGTSMASPHVAGAAAILASRSNPESLADVVAIRDTILEEGNSGWTDSSGDGIQEPLLDVSNEEVFAPNAAEEEEEAEAPTATTEAATGVTSSGAKLNGLVDPNGSSTTYQFEYGTTTSYGTKVPALPKGVGSGTSGVAVSETIGGLAAETTYHFRVVASNAGGTVNGADKTFVTSAAPEASEWEIEPTVNPGAPQLLRNVSCNTAGLCMAVGAYASGPLAQVWEGTEWKNSATSTGAELNDVSCVVLTFSECGAIGSKFGQAWGQKWSKSSGIWATMFTPTPFGASSSEFLGGGCAPIEAKLVCLGVGTYTAFGEQLTMAMRWDTATQKFIILETPSAGEGSVLNDVSCNTVTSCVAVGYFVESGEKRPLALHWNGTGWWMETVPNSEAGGADTYLNDVSCTGSGESTECIAVGANEGGGPSQVAVSMYWNGAEWSEITPDEPVGLEGDFELQSVACVSGSECHAVGSYEENAEVKTLIEEWDGAEWVVSPSPNPEGSSSSALTGVSCIVSSGDCIAVGYSENDTLAVHRE